MKDAKLTSFGFAETRLFNAPPKRREVLEADGLGRKQIELIDLGNSQIASLSEFSIPSMLKSPKYLGGWNHHSVFNRSIREALLKAAAAVMVGKHPTKENFYFSPIADSSTGPN